MHAICNSINTHICNMFNILSFNHIYNVHTLEVFLYRTLDTQLATLYQMITNNSTIPGHEHDVVGKGKIVTFAIYSGQHTN